MMNRVMWLDEAFHTVRLDRGSIVLGRMNGNIDRPTVAMIPIAEADEPPNARGADRRHKPSRAKIAPPKPSTGAISIQGWRPKLSTQAPGAAAVTVRSGLDGA